MLQIDIVEGNPATGDLTLKVNGVPNNGRNKAKPKENVHWKVSPNCNVEAIYDIKMKTGPGAPPSTNVFVGDPPARQSNGKHWKGKVSGNAPVGAEYNYDIEWVPKAGGGVKVYDPKISIMPPTSVIFRTFMRIVELAFTCLGILALTRLISKKKKYKQ